MLFPRQQSYGPWDAVGQIASAIMQRNQQRGQEKKDLQSLQTIIGLQQPSEVDTGTGMRSQVNFDPSLQKVNMQQPQNKLFDFAKIGQTPPIYNGPQEQQPIGLMQPQQVTGQNALTMSQQPAPQIQSPTITQRERTIKDVEGDIRKSYATRMQEAIKSGSITPTMLRQYMPQIQQQMSSEIEQARGDYSKKQEQAAWTAFDAAPDYRTKMMTGIKAGLNPQLLKMALDTGTEIKMIDTGDKIVPVSIDPRNNKVIDMTTGNPVDSATLTKGLTQYQRESLDLTRRGQDITMRGQDISAASRSGGGGSGSDSTFTKGENQALTRAGATINAFNSRWRDQYTGELKPGHMNDPLYPSYQQAINIQNQIYGSKQQGQDQPGEQSQGDPTAIETGYIQEAVRSGVPVDRIIQGLQGRSAELAARGVDANALIAQLRPPRKQPQMTDYSGLDEVNNNWQF